MHSNAANRLDRLPISRLRKITLVAVSFAYFFEFADINSFATTVPKLVSLWGVTINQIAYVTSLSFIGMFLGSLVASWLADRWGRSNRPATAGHHPLDLPGRSHAPSGKPRKLLADPPAARLRTPTAGPGHPLKQAASHIAAIKVGVREARSSLTAFGHDP
ncbi:hypothetical protein GCM10023081_03030 [Arthrobacter ginkgonis]|uniref:Major facilitator superfamily (MFS) profile domain-containing protein n=2 Tax=Arthrobacter ginkgonis TaxID=1630594 RepID=A0ABP7BT20_9MICC